MKIFLSAIENNSRSIQYMPHMKWNLCSYYYLKQDIFETVLANTDEMLIDSGAHSFQKGKKVNWEQYTEKYANFIKENDCDKILGYFEMDVDNIIGYNKVLMLRSILESKSGTGCKKIIPVWHKNRGIADFKQMCQDYQGRIIAITGFRNEDIRDEQYLMFLKYAKKFNCKVHCLGMTRRQVLDKVPFDFVDSSSWKQGAIYGRVGNRKVTKEQSKNDIDHVIVASYLEGMKMQDHYYHKWKVVCKD